MKKLAFLLFVLVSLTACGGGTGFDDSSDRSQYRELSLDRESSDAITTVGEVDWYHFRAVETNNVLQVRLSGETDTPQVEFLVTVYEKNANGDLVRLWADHAPEDAALPANLVLNIPIPEPKDLYIAVRDLLDDEAAPQTRYRLQLAYTNPTTDNATFGQATDLGSVESEGICHTDAIETVADVDCFSFSVAADGVYSVAATFNDADISTPVRLEMKLYEADGTSIYPAAGETVLNTRYRVYLEAGQHFVVLQDRGKNDADAFAQYTVCIHPLTVAEVMQNDNELTADAMTQDTGAAHPKYDVQAAIAYQQDQDWYFVPVDLPSGTEFQTLKLTFGDTVPAGNNFPFQILIKEDGGSDIMDHEYPAGEDQYTVQVRVTPGDHLIAVRPSADATVTEGLNYTMRVEVIGVEDAAESAPNDNDTLATADALVTPADTVTGKISFRGDNDWYQVDVPNDVTDQILGIAFQAQSTSDVAYCVEIMRGGDLWTLSDTNHLDTATQLKTSFYAAAGTESTYFIKVCDCQGDDGDDIAYDLSITTSEIAPVGDVGAMNDATLNPEGKPTIYVSETAERSLISGIFETGEAVDVTCAIYPQYTPVFKANNQLLKYSSLDANNQYVSDWIAGFVDYQGDQDWYVLDINPMIPAGGSEIPEDWYYDIQVRFYTPGSDVEYTWKLYRDVSRGGAPNQVVVERTPGTTDIDYADDRDGIMAAWATSLVTDPTAAVTQIVPDSGQPFWIGDPWQNDRFYLAVSDFNYTRLSDSVFNPVPDDDWGYDAPYYFQVRLTFHPDVSNP